MYFVYAALLAILPSLQFERRGIHVGATLLKWVVLTLALTWVVYAQLPAFAGYGLGWMWVILFLTLVLNLFQWPRDGDPRLPALLVVGGGVLLAAFVVSSLPILRSTELAAVVGKIEKKEWNSSLAPVDPKHIRLVSAEQAEWIGAKALSEGLGSVYHPGEYSLQKIGDHLFWVAALDFQDWRRWISGSSAPGAIIVDAQDPTIPARLVQKDKAGNEIRLRYTPGAYFSKNLERHVWSSGYSTYKLRGFHLEFDDAFHPWWIITAMKPTIGFSGLRVHSVLVVNPESGELKEYSQENAPPWIDRIVPEEAVVENLKNWGLYREGWWSSVLGSQSLLEPTALNGQAAWLVYGQDSRCYWYSGLTSTSDRDDTLLGYTLTDTRTGQTVEYKVTGITAGTANAAVKAAAAKVSNFRGYHPTQPIPYNIYGHLAYVIPIVNENHLFQRVAVVDVTCQQVALGEDKQSALQEFKQLLGGASGNASSPTLDASLRSLTVKVLRRAESVRNGNTTVYLYADKVPGRTFFGSVAQGHQLFLTREGDTVVIKYLDTDEQLIPIQEIKNPALTR